MRKSLEYSNKIYILYHNACGFMKTSFILLNNPNKLGSDCNQFAIAAVNGLFASEIFLKFIKAYDDAINKNGSKNNEIEIHQVHDVSTLFSELNQSRKIQIYTEMDRLRCDKSSFDSFLAFLNREKQKKDRSADPVFWRYLLDKNQSLFELDLNTLIKFNQSLYRITHGIMMLLQQDIELPTMSSPAIDEVSREIINDNLYNSYSFENLK